MVERCMTRLEDLSGCVRLERQEVVEKIYVSAGILRGWAGRLAVLRICGVMAVEIDEMYSRSKSSYQVQ